MSPTKALSCAARYDRALRYARDSRLPDDFPKPQPTKAWPAENVALLESYQEWLSSSGTSQPVIETIYLPMAGHVLGLNLKPCPQLDLAADLEKAMDYVKAKQLSAEWTDMCRNALVKFRRFLRQERGQVAVKLRPPSYGHYCAGLPAWLVQELERFQHLRQSHWRQTRLNEQTVRFWSGHTRLWRWLFAQYPVKELADIRRQHLLDYVDHRLAAGYAASGVTADLRFFRAFLLFLQDQDYRVPQALLRLPRLKLPDSLPRFLSDHQVLLLRDDLENRVVTAALPSQRRDALLDRAAFYLMWQAGLRLGEVEELQVEDLGFTGRKLLVRQGKGRKDRAVYLTDRTVQALQGYLAVRGRGPTSHVFLYRNEPVHKDLLCSRIKAAGERVGVRVYPHRLRHTCATQLLNAGCRVTSIQSLLGHRRLNSTMVYARVHDRTVADDYYAAMARVEERLDLVSEQKDDNGLPGEDQRVKLLAMVERLSEPSLNMEERLDLAAQMRLMLDQLLPRSVSDRPLFQSLPDLTT